MKRISITTVDGRSRKILVDVGPVLDAAQRKLPACTYCLADWGQPCRKPGFETCPPHRVRELEALKVSEASLLHARFWSKVDKSPRKSGCWLWTGGTNPDGYGRFRVPVLGDIRGRLVYAHRFAYELLVGKIPDGLQLDHVRTRGCKKTNCVNPKHLEPVTNRENGMRGLGRGGKRRPS